MLRSCRKLIGYHVHAKDGPVGELYDFYFDDRTNRIIRCVVSIGTSRLGLRVLIHPDSFGRPDHERKILAVTISIAAVIYLVPRVTTGWYLFIPFVICGVGLGLMVSQLNNYTLSPVDEERISEAAGVNSAAGSFGMSFGLAFAGAILLMMLSFTFTYLSNTSTILAEDQKAQVATALEHDAEVMSNTQMNEALVGQTPEVQQEIVRINTIARPIALQVALLVPLLAGVMGLIIGFRMIRLPDPVASSAAEEMVLG